ncbi:PREDICTED: calmodulin-A-like [Branchiostoma belcheri]|uniref:Calmodulin-A-like n=1 Tax=Branchiostoma belcheri TaxID=7741 RepID=A0A6P4Y2I8_BRABE|nr:PREDICTED: calmodulin-A-like [Branchiostoma belcheri]
MLCCYCTGDEENNSGSNASKNDSPSASQSFISGPQLEEYRDAFNLFDKDGDGLISLDELWTAMRDMGQFTSEEDLRELLHEVDPDGGMTIQFEDFVVILSSILKAEADVCLPEDEEGELREAFKLFDKEGNGYITSSDLRQVLNCLGQDLSEEEVDDMIGEVDQDGDGKIDYDEFATAVCGITDKQRLE